MLRDPYPGQDEDLHELLLAELGYSGFGGSHYHVSSGTAEVPLPIPLVVRETCVPLPVSYSGGILWSLCLVNTAIAVERYRSIVGAKRYQIQHRSGVKTFVVIGVVWLASFLFSSVPLYPVMYYHSTLEICLPAMPNLLFQSYSIVLIVVWYAIPLVVIAFTYVSIKKRVTPKCCLPNIDVRA